MGSLQDQIVQHHAAAAASLEAKVRWAKPYQMAIYRVALTLTGSEADADYVLVETIQCAWDRYICGVNQRPSLLEVLRIAVRESVMSQRGRAGDLAGWIEEPESHVGNIPVTATQWEANLGSLFTPREWQKIRQLALESMTPMDRTVFLLRDVLRFSTSETAELIERNEMAVKVRVARARFRLREFLSPICRKQRADERAPVRQLGFASLQSA